MTSSVGIRALKQNASAVIARAAAGETIEITDRGRPVAQLTPLRGNRYQELVEAGQISPPSAQLADLLATADENYTAPRRDTSRVSSEDVLREQRDERF